LNGSNLIVIEEWKTAMTTRSRLVLGLLILGIVLVVFARPMVVTLFLLLLAALAWVGGGWPSIVLHSYKGGWGAAAVLNIIGYGLLAAAIWVLRPLWWKSAGARDKLNPAESWLPRSAKRRG
jgi:hypothetical protein